MQVAVELTTAWAPQDGIEVPSAKNSTEPDGLTGPGRVVGGVTTAVMVVLWCTVAGVDTERETEVESGETGSMRLPVEPGAVEAVSGVNVAAACTGEADAANEVWHAAVACDGEIGTPTQLTMGAAPFVKVIVPDGEPADVTVATNVTVSFVTGAAGKTESEVVEGPGAWKSVAWPDTEPSVAVIVDGPAVVEPLICTL